MGCCATKSQLPTNPNGSQRTPAQTSFTPLNPPPEPPQQKPSETESEPQPMLDIFNNSINEPSSQLLDNSEDSISFSRSRSNYMLLPSRPLEELNTPTMTTHDQPSTLPRYPSTTLNTCRMPRGDSDDSSIVPETMPYPGTENLHLPQNKSLVRGFDDFGNKLLNEYAVIGHLGQGAFGKVKLALDTKGDCPVAIKVLNKKVLSRMSTSLSGILPEQHRTPLELVRQEILIMKTRRHPNLVKLINVIDDPDCDKLYLVMEYMEGGTLAKTPSYRISSVTSTRPPLNIERLQQQFADMVCGLRFLHRKNVIHMDIKPENILVGADGTCKLADFGVCTILSENFALEDTSKDILHTQHGTPTFFAPEMLCGDGFHGCATDVWALGVTLYVLVYGHLPFEGQDLQEYHKNVISTTTTIPFPSTIQSLSNTTSEEVIAVPVPRNLIDVMRRMLHKDASKRITTSELATHPYVVGDEGCNPSRVPLEWHVKLWKEGKHNSIK